MKTINLKFYLVIIVGRKRGGAGLGVGRESKNSCPVFM